ncbi:MAG: NHLP bacteriocin system secretion protein, partial [Phycisphaerae bacterium]|nr:NHLP bacteriocin system secretion protein [Gemmatimonadaceae bacterium]
MAKASPFRQAALDRLSNPEQLDQLLEVTRPKAWIALAGIWLLIAVALAWSIFGRIPVTISGTGILLSEAGVREVEALGSGVIQTLSVREGQLIEQGTLIAQISQPRREQEVAQAADRLQLLRDERKSRQSFLSTNTTLETQRHQAGRQDIERRLTVLRDRNAYLETRVKAERDARALGLVTESSVQASVQELERGRSEVASLELELKNNALAELLVTNRNTETIEEVEDRIREAERALAALRLTLGQESSVRSPYRGYVREIRTNIGQLTSAGQPIVSIELAGVPLHALVFVSNEGKRIE